MHYQILILGFSNQSQQSCLVLDNGYYRDGKCYIFIIASVSWAAARQVCLNIKMDLVTIETAEEQAWLDNIINGNTGM